MCLFVFEASKFTPEKWIWREIENNTSNDEEVTFWTTAGIISMPHHHHHHNRSYPILLWRRNRKLYERKLTETEKWRDENENKKQVNVIQYILFSKTVQLQHDRCHYYFTRSLPFFLFFVFLFRLVKVFVKKYEFVVIVFFYKLGSCISFFRFLVQYISGLYVFSFLLFLPAFQLLFTFEI